jgi:hypothetical protein
MTANKRERTDLDDLLKRALADDLPADVAAGMRERIARFRSAAAGEKERAAAGAWLFRRAVWAAVSVLMLVSGILLQGSASRSPLADRISRVKAGFAAVEPGRGPGFASSGRTAVPDLSPVTRRMSHERES